MTRAPTRSSHAHRAPWRWLRGRAALPVLAVGPQAPAVVAIGAACGHWLLASAPALALTAAFFAGRRERSFRPRSRVHLYLGLWPFFAWWSGCFIFAGLAPVALIIGVIAGTGPAAPLAAAGFTSAACGLAAVRRSPRVVSVSLAFPDLPPDLDGVRIAQLSDVHCGVFAPAPRLDRWVRRANGLGAELIAVTGDLIASGDDHIDAAAAALAGLRAPHGVFACMGNHDYFGDGERLVSRLGDGGVRVLRNEWTRVRRNGGEIVIAGVDDTWSRRADLERTLAGVPDGAFVLLLAHDPDLFPHIAERELPLTLSGHTHGGQLAVPLLARRYNLARFAHRYHSGLYREGRSTLYVNRGIGTSGPPIRIGTRGEIAVITLHRGAACARAHTPRARMIAFRSRGATCGRRRGAETGAAQLD